MKKILNFLLSTIVSTSAFAQITLDTPTNVEAGVEATSNTKWEVKSNITIDGKMSFPAKTDQYAILVSNSTLEIGSTGVLEMNSDPYATVVTHQNLIRLGNWGVKSGTLTIQEGGKVILDKITMSGNNDVVNVYAPDALTPCVWDYSQLYFFMNGNFNMLGAGDYKLSFQAQADKVATVSFVENANLNIMSLGNTNNFSMKLVDFTDKNSIFFSSKVSGVKADCILELSELDSGDYTVSFYDGETLKNTITITGADLNGFSFSQSTVDGVNGYLLAVAIPEPAEWAMIFGALALGFAIYRRRK